MKTAFTIFLILIMQGAWAQSDWYQGMVKCYIEPLDSNSLIQIDSTYLFEDSMKVYTFVEQQPEFPGGTLKREQFIKQNLKFPPNLLDLEGTVYVGFIVNKDGSLSEFAIKRGTYPALDKEALRVCRKMPNWIPGKQNGRLVKVLMTVPVKFKWNS